MKCERMSESMRSRVRQKARVRASDSEGEECRSIVDVPSLHKMRCHSQTFGTKAIGKRENARIFEVIVGIWMQNTGFSFLK